MAGTDITNKTELESKLQTQISDLDKDIQSLNNEHKDVEYNKILTGLQKLKSEAKENLNSFQQEKSDPATANGNYDNIHSRRVVLIISLDILDHIKLIEGNISQLKENYPNIKYQKILKELITLKAESEKNLRLLNTTNLEDTDKKTTDIESRITGLVKEFDLLSTQPDSSQDIKSNPETNNDLTPIQSAKRQSTVATDPKLKLIQEMLSHITRLYAYDTPKNKYSNTIKNEFGYTLKQMEEELNDLRNNPTGDLKTWTDEELQHWENDITKIETEIKKKISPIDLASLRSELQETINSDKLELLDKLITQLGFLQNELLETSDKNSPKALELQKLLTRSEQNIDRLKMNKQVFMINNYYTGIQNSIDQLYQNLNASESKNPETILPIVTDSMIIEKQAEKDTSLKGIEKPSSIVQTNTAATADSRYLADDMSKKDNLDVTPPDKSRSKPATIFKTFANMAGLGRKKNTSEQSNIQNNTGGVTKTDSNLSVNEKINAYRQLYTYLTNLDPTAREEALSSLKTDAGKVAYRNKHTEWSNIFNIPSSLDELKTALSELKKSNQFKNEITNLLTELQQLIPEEKKYLAYVTLIKILSGMKTNDQRKKYMQNFREDTSKMAEWAKRAAPDTFPDNLANLVINYNKAKSAVDPDLVKPETEEQLNKLKQEHPTSIASQYVKLAADLIFVAPKKQSEFIESLNKKNDELKKIYPDITFPITLDQLKEKLDEIVAQRLEINGVSIVTPYIEQIIQERNGSIQAALTPANEAGATIKEAETIYKKQVATLQQSLISIPENDALYSDMKATLQTLLERSRINSSGYESKTKNRVEADKEHDSIIKDLNTAQLTLDPLVKKRNELQGQIAYLNMLRLTMPSDEVYTKSSNKKLRRLLNESIENLALFEKNHSISDSEITQKHIETELTKLQLNIQGLKSKEANVEAMFIDLNVNHTASFKDIKNAYNTRHNELEAQIKLKEPDNKDLKKQLKDLNASWLLVNTADKLKTYNQATTYSRALTALDNTIEKLRLRVTELSQITPKHIDLDSIQARYKYAQEKRDQIVKLHDNNAIPESLSPTALQTLLSNGGMLTLPATLTSGLQAVEALVNEDNKGNLTKLRSAAKELSKLEKSIPSSDTKNIDRPVYDQALNKLQNAMAVLIDKDKNDMRIEHALLSVKNIQEIYEFNMRKETPLWDGLLETLLGKPSMDKQKAARKNTDDKLLKTLVEGLNNLTDIVSSDTPNKLITAIEKHDEFEKTLPKSKKWLPFKVSSRQLLYAGVVLVLAGAFVALSIKFPWIRTVPRALHFISSAMGMEIPGLAGLITYQSVAVNMVLAVGGAYLLKKYAPNPLAAYKEWRYNKALAGLEATIEAKQFSTDPTDQILLEGARSSRDGIRAIKLSGDKSIQTEQLTTALQAMNKALKDPSKIENLEKAAAFGDKLPPESVQAETYAKFVVGLAAIAVVAGVGMWLAGTALENTPIIAPLGTLMVGASSTMFGWGMAAAGWTIPGIPVSITGGALLPQVAVGKPTGIATMTLLDRKTATEIEQKSQAMKEQLVDESVKQGNPEHDDSQKHNLVRAMGAFKTAVDNKSNKDYIPPVSSTAAWSLKRKEMIKDESVISTSNEKSTSRWAKIKASASSAYNMLPTITLFSKPDTEKARASNSSNPTSTSDNIEPAKSKQLTTLDQEFKHPGNPTFHQDLTARLKSIAHKDREGLIPEIAHQDKENQPGVYVIKYHDASDLEKTHLPEHDITVTTTHVSASVPLNLTDKQLDQRAGDMVSAYIASGKKIENLKFGGAYKDPSMEPFVKALEKAIKAYKDELIPITLIDDKANEQNMDSAPSSMNRR